MLRKSMTLTLILLAFVSGGVFAQSPSGLIGIEWKSNLCLENSGSSGSRKDCPSERYIKPGDRFQVRQAKGGGLELYIIKANGSAGAHFRLYDLDLCTTTTCPRPELNAKFDDFGTIKSLRLFVVFGEKDQPGHKDECDDWFSDKAPDHKLSDDDIDAQCNEAALLFWRIDTEGPALPDDGHGTGTPP